MFTSTFDFQGKCVKVHIGHDFKEIFHGADVCRALGKDRNHSRLIKTYVFPEYWIEVPNPNGGSAVLCVYEPGLYQLALNPIFDSETAREFQKLVFEKILPKLRASRNNSTPVDVASFVETATAEMSDRLNHLLDIERSKVAALEASISATPVPQPKETGFCKSMANVLSCTGIKQKQTVVNAAIQYLVEGVDYQVEKHYSGRRGRPKHLYFFTQEVFEHLAIAHRSKRGLDQSQLENILYIKLKTFAKIMGQDRSNEVFPHQQINLF